MLNTCGRQGPELMLYNVNEECINRAKELKMSNISEVNFVDEVVPEDLQRKLNHYGRVNTKQPNSYHIKKAEKEQMSQQGIKRLKGHTDEGELVTRSRKCKVLDFSGNSTEDYKHKL